ncbi:MAG: AAA family ATPase [Planctomycetes bacterium]|nr:AAA family ATPase [Planctomycetota bacterium]
MDPRSPESRSRGLTGLVLGKFLPPHAGHLHLLAAARAQVDRLAVVVGSLKREPVPGALRFEWMRELCPRDDVFHLTEELPQEPHEHPRFWELWTAALRRFLPTGPDVVFTSESYGDELAKRLGARHVCVDNDRKAFPVSGTAIRRDPMAHWEFIPECVRPYFVKRVVVYGPESTGKTTLAKRLAEEFRTEWVPEFARDYLDRKGAWVEPADFPLIAAGQIATENAAARRARRVIFCDSDLNTTVIYANQFVGACPVWIERSSRIRPYDLFLLCEPDIRWTPDWQRDHPQRRAYFREWFRARLDEQGRSWRSVTGEGEARVASAMAAVESLLRK